MKYKSNEFGGSILGTILERVEKNYIQYNISNNCSFTYIYFTLTLINSAHIKANTNYKVYYIMRYNVQHKIIYNIKHTTCYIIFPSIASIHV